MISEISHNSEHNDKNKDINIGCEESPKVLCAHCGRTAENGIKCIGKCVSDTDY